MDCRDLRFLRGLGVAGRCCAGIFARHARAEALTARAHRAWPVPDVTVRGQGNCHHGEAHGIVRDLNFPEPDDRH